MVASGFLFEKWSQSTLDSKSVIMSRIGELLSIPLIICSISFPFAGLLSDKYGRRVNLLLLSSVMLFLTYFLIFRMPPVIPAVLLGLSYAIFCSVLWPMMALIAPQRLLVYFFPSFFNKKGTVYGVATVAINLTMTVFPMVLAYLNHVTSSYVPVRIFLNFLKNIGHVLLTPTFRNHNCDSLWNKIL
jgi:MFS family permease